MFLAAYTGQADTVRLLLENRADPEARDVTGFNAIHSAAEGVGNTKCVELMLQAKVEVDVKTTSGQNTPLHLAATRGSLQCVQFLIKHGSSVNVRNVYSKTPLYLAVQFRWPEIVYMLLNNGALVNCAAVDNTTCLDCAILQSDRLSTEIILDHRGKAVTASAFPPWVVTLIRKRQQCNATAKAAYALYYFRLKMPRDLARRLARVVWDSRYDGKWVRVE